MAEVGLNLSVRAPIRRDGDRPVPPQIDDRPRPPQGDTYRRGSGRPTPPPVSGSRDYDRPAPPPVSGGRDHDYGRPTPPPVNPGYGRDYDRDYDRPAPPPVNPGYGGDYDHDYDRPVPPPVNPGYGYDRPVPPPVHPDRYRGPRYYWTPSFPIIPPTEVRPIPHIPLPQRPEPARRVDPSEVSLDVFQLLGESGRLRTRKHFLWVFPYHPKISGGEARNMLAAGKPVYVGPDSGWHFSGSYQAVSGEKQLDSYQGEARARKLQQMQAAEDRAYQSRLGAWAEGDVSRRMSNLPSFNSIYDTNRLSLNNYMISYDGRSFNRNLITAMNIYNKPEVRREIARKWHENPDMNTGQFNAMANQVITRHVSNLFWNAQHQGDWGTYLGTNPVPGLRFPDYQEDVDWNASVIRQVASELPLLLNSSVLTN